MRGLSKEQVRVAMKDPSHLKAWLHESGRRWLLLDAIELVDALPWPDGVESLMQVLTCYRDHRRAIPTGRVEQQKHPDTGESIDVPIMKEDVLEVEELDRAVRYLMAQLIARYPQWKIENPEM